MIGKTMAFFKKVDNVARIGSGGIYYDGGSSSSIAYNTITNPLLRHEFRSDLRYDHEIQYSEDHLG